MPSRSALEVLRSFGNAATAEPKALVKKATTVRTTIPNRTDSLNMAKLTLLPIDAKKSGLKLETHSIY